MRSRLMTLAATLSMTLSLPAIAAPIVFVNDEAGFDSQAALQSLALVGTEDWELAAVAPNSVIVIDDPLSPGVANLPAFPTGSNAATGMTVQSNTNGFPGGVSPRGNQSLVLATTGFVGVPTNQLFNNFEGDGIDLIFGVGGAMAVSLTPLFLDSSLANIGGDIAIRVFDMFNTEINSTVVGGVSALDANSFFGIVAMPGQAIGRINLFDGNSLLHFQGADNIDVYQVGQPPMPVPEPATLLLLGLGLAGLGLSKRKEKR